MQMTQLYLTTTRVTGSLCNILSSELCAFVKWLNLNFLSLNFSKTKFVVHDIIKRIRSIAIPSFLPIAIKTTLKSVPILPGKIWNISNQLISRIQSQKTNLQTQQVVPLLSSLSNSWSLLRQQR